MTERSRRSVLLFFALLLLAVQTWKSHGVPPERKTVAFPVFEASKSVVRVRGGSPGDGIHKFPDGTDWGTVINVTVSEGAENCLGAVIARRSIPKYAEVSVHSRTGKCPEISIDKLRARERMLLGIPLEVSEMDAADWQAVDGVGPALAKRIIENRQHIGGHYGIDSLQMVPGIGDVKLQSIMKNF